MDWQTGLIVAIYISIPFVALATRTWIKSYVERRLQHQFDTKLEEIKADSRRAEELLKSALRSREAENSVLRDSIFSGRAQRQALLDKRRIEAIEKLWIAVNSLGPLKRISAAMAIIKFEEFAREAASNENARKLITVMIGGYAFNQSEWKTRDEQPFLPPLAWAIFLAYEAVVVHAYGRAKLLEAGIEEAPKLIDVESLRKILVAALPHQAKFIEQHEVGAYHYLLDELETKLMAELMRALDNTDVDQLRIKQAEEIISAIAKLENKDVEIQSILRTQKLPES